MKYVLFGLVIFLSACEPKYETETRFLLEAKIVDTGKKPIRGEVFCLYAKNGNEPYRLATSITNESGGLRFLFPKLKSCKPVTYSLRHIPSPDYISSNSIEINEKRFSDSFVNLKTVPLLRRSKVIQLTVSIQSDSSLLNLQLALSGKFFEESDDYGYDSCRVDSLNACIRNYKVLANQTLVHSLQYLEPGSDSLRTRIDNIPINNRSNIYEIQL